MDESEARRRLSEFVASRTKDGKVDPPWLDQLDLSPLPNGEWLAFLPQVPVNGVRLREEETIMFLGALGKNVPRLRLPRTRELILGSTWSGRYQSFDGGLAVWEELNLDGQRRDLAYPIVEWSAFEKRARECNAMIGFFDLRGFSTWSKKQSPERIQWVVEKLENAFQAAFARPLEGWPQIFAKGTGDGLMVVSESGWHDPSEPEVQPEHARTFCRSCAETVRGALKALTDGGFEFELPIGCGVTAGAISQFYILGRFDYVGDQVNEASKIQQIAYNELCVSTEVVTLLDHRVARTQLTDKRWRISLAALLD